MIILTLAEIAGIVGGTLHDALDPRARVTAGMDFDSRNVQPGGIFLALRGEKADGHDYAVSAVKDGSALVFATRPVGVPAVVVGDVLAAAGALASHLAGRLTGTLFIGVTGSSGKTSTKDLIAHVLSNAGETVATIGNHNGEIGTPETVSRADLDTRFLVLEMGARGIGHLRELTDMVPLDVAAVLNVGTAHAGTFGGREAIAQAKGELVEHLRPEDLAVLNADDPLVRAMTSRTQARVVLVGGAAEAHIRAEAVRMDDRGRARFQLVTPEGSAKVALQLIGEHHVGNALTAAAIGREGGLSVDQLSDALSTALPASRWRMEVDERPDGITIVNDAYNANPESMRASLHALVAMSRGRRTVAVLGEMRELGADTEREHTRLGELIAELSISQLITVGGPEAKRIQQAALRGGVDSLHVPDQGAAHAFLHQLLVPGDVVLVKASRGANLQNLAERLTQSHCA
ncbi:UDP-N-acetylmuramoyl-tripeptide--D-alanyl-D-alanine ligase [Streptomyces rhizosphaericus]|uniref:UDP-N-acetylmuramoyl-tripeptide--D-alanyl-D-alanine ligase n=1 Tax=Streptomyces rhizosphaericus TaxID=114699 RepID=A0A6G4AW54_9ACTN|nr:UDP-N-acetylmuramoyl-tripeptide--D-alanyl-D-alanine ligase [Streptomyces rhizosphaericus]NEW77478.1 UDP-N-acetylmuramoyl-tripeptide--D-alanyl-D-alanine ligase [Streptomyces rhizosphaericus]